MYKALREQLDGDLNSGKHIPDVLPDAEPGVPECGGGNAAVPAHVRLPEPHPHPRQE